MLTLDYAKHTCLIGQGALTCRYAAFTEGQFRCLKLTSFRAELDARVANNTMHAHGDNCDGFVDEVLGDAQ